jgi:hypothetical protein
VVRRRHGAEGSGGLVAAFEDDATAAGRYLGGGEEAVGERERLGLVELRVEQRVICRATAGPRLAQISGSAAK